MGHTKAGSYPGPPDMASAPGRGCSHFRLQVGFGRRIPHSPRFCAPFSSRASALELPAPHAGAALRAPPGGASG
jgi:hypothetical protein